MTHIFTAAVIPAQAGIQTDTKPLRSGDNTQNMALPATRNLYDKLDSRLRGNDEFSHSNSPRGNFGFPSARE